MLIKDQKKFEQVIVELKVVSPDQLDTAKIESVKLGKSLDEVLLESGAMS